jgi:hypothetical protein
MRCHILDVELRLAGVTREDATVEFVAEGLRYRVVFSLSDDDGGDEFYTPAPRENGEVRVAKGQVLGHFGPVPQRVLHGFFHRQRRALERQRALRAI